MNFFWKIKNVRIITDNPRYVNIVIKIYNNNKIIGFLFVFLFDSNTLYSFLQVCLFIDN